MFLPESPYKRVGASESNPTAERTPFSQAASTVGAAVGGVFENHVPRGCYGVNY